MKRDYALIATILLGLAEVKGTPESYLYIGLMKEFSHLDEFNNIIDIMKESKLIQVKHHYVTITKKGLELVDALNKARGVA